ncbi:MAG: hypothetical protein ABR530_10575 [Pyrinomonadaceae bacterium]
MSSFIWIIVLVLVLTAVGSLTLLFITVKYYWGERGAPPLTGEARRKQKEMELAMRAKQISYSEQNPPKPRSQSFWNNRKRQ